ncbi:hypothetical protein K7432_008979 [Basidiobolus ranarum]|uniref:Uncharacterized protein n=1 Tax=Basidiobolus ranarum TaxID=34480 RepID=A0ABR2VYJ7_9FUNG
MLIKSFLILFSYLLASTYGYVSRLPDSEENTVFLHDSEDTFLEQTSFTDEFLPPREEDHCREEHLEIGPICPLLAERFPHFNGCCQYHIMCYSSCSSRTSKEECDIGFSQCLQKECVNSLDSPNWLDQRRCIAGWAWSGNSMREFEVSKASDFTCSAFDSFRRKCDFFFDVPI